MKLIHAQIYGAIVSILLVGTLLFAMSLKQDLRKERRNLADLGDKAAEQERAAKARAAGGGGDKPADRQQLELELAALRQRLDSLTAERDRFLREAERLRAELAVRGGAAGPGPALPGTLAGLGPQVPPPPSPEGFPDAPPGPPPVMAPPPAPRHEPWGASEDVEMEAMAKALKLEPQQKDQVRLIIMDSQNEFERRLIEASQRGEGDISLLERIGEELSKKTEQRIRQILFPGQQRDFDDYMQKLREGG
jgi:hypothetical protein